MIVVSGEALMDVFAAGETASGMGLDARIGGSPLNVAMGLARLQQASAFFGAVSTGFLGDRLMKALRDEGVNTACTQRLNAPTTLSLVGLSTSGLPNYDFYSHAAVDRLLPLSALADVPTAQAYHFGSYAMVVEPVASTQRALIERECKRSVIAYDPNIRANVEPDITRWQECLRWMLPRTHVLKVSDEDIALLYPGANLDELANAWLGAGVRLLVITRGGEGALAYTAEHRLVVPPVKVSVVDTVGAGDTFQAALLCALAERGLLSTSGLLSLSLESLTEVTNFAAKAASITCSRRGADLPRRADLA